MLSKDNEQAILITQARKNMLTNFCYNGFGYLEWYCNLTTDQVIQLTHTLSYYETIL